MSGSNNGWLIWRQPVNRNSGEAVQHSYDMPVSFSPDHRGQNGQIPPGQYSDRIPDIDAALWDMDNSSGWLFGLSAQQAAPLAPFARQVSWDQAPHATPVQSFGPPMYSSQQAAPPAQYAGQAPWSAAPYAAPLQSVAVPTYPAQQIAPPAQYAGHTPWSAAPYTASLQQVAVRKYSAQQMAPPAPFVPAQRYAQAPLATRAPSVAARQYPAPQVPAPPAAEIIDLTGDDDGKVAPSKPARQPAGTKKARSDNTSGTATQRMKKAKKAKEANKPRIPNSGMRMPTTAATFPPEVGQPVRQAETLAETTFPPEVVQPVPRPETLVDTAFSPGDMVQPAAKRDIRQLERELFEGLNKAGY